MKILKIIFTIFMDIKSVISFLMFVLAFTICLKVVTYPFRSDENQAENIADAKASINFVKDIVIESSRIVSYMINTPTNKEFLEEIIQQRQYHEDQYNKLTETEKQIATDKFHAALDKAAALRDDRMRQRVPKN